MKLGQRARKQAGTPGGASVDLEGLKKLQAMLEKYQGILEMMEPEEVPPMTGMEKDAQGVWKPKGQ
jgi:hypothetical protein